MTLSTIKITTITLSLILLSACGGGGGDEKEAIDTTKSNLVKSNTQKIIYTVPSPIEMAMLLQKANAKYDSKILNDVQNTPKYTSNASKAINLGVFGADLTYTSVLDQTQESMLYLTASKKLADGLGITEAFKKETVERLQNNINNKDSMMAVISDAFTEIDGYLQENDRANVSALVITGGWLEGLYIATMVAKSVPNNESVKARIADQKLSLESLKKILSAYSEDPAANDLAKDLQSLGELYNSVEVKNTPAKVETNKTTGVVSIGGDEEKPTLSPELFEKICVRIGEIRNKLIK